MNSTCAHCGHRLEEQRLGNILCFPCELAWWNKVKHWYAEKIKDLGL